jgi:4a-hydroxytetrahydrobiopterin dehydratase
MDLKDKKCIPCEGGIKPLSELEIESYRKSIHTSWQLNKEKHIVRDFRFINFKMTMDFVNKVAQLAEEEGHHPVAHVGYGICTIELWTHAINGLSENDFILAAKIDDLLKTE